MLIPRQTARWLSLIHIFIDLSESAKTAEVMIEKENNEKEKVLEMNIDELELSVRSYNCLKRAGINTVEELCNRTSEDMMKVRNLGRDVYKRQGNRHKNSSGKVLKKKNQSK